MKNDLASAIGYIRIGVGIGFRIGCFWHHAIEPSNRRIDRRLEGKDWAWSNRRQQRPRVPDYY